MVILQMQFPPIKKINQNINDNYVKNIKKNPQASGAQVSTNSKPGGGGVSGLGIQGGSIPAEFRQTMKHNSSN